MVDERIVLCMKWGTLFPPDYVNVLYNACRGAISGHFRFVCLTDDADGFVEGIEALPIPDIGLEPREWYMRGVWPKLALYVADLHGLKGRCLFIDLDMVVLRGLDEMFDFGRGFVATDMGDGWRPGGREGAAQEPGTCVFAFEIGGETQILDAFSADKTAAMQSFQNEQDFAGAHAKTMEFWPEGWVISFKRHLRQPIGRDVFLRPKKPSESVKIVAFHGDPRPIALVPNRPGFWDRFPHMGHGQVDWVSDYWLENGGRMPPFEAE